MSDLTATEVLIKKEDIIDTSKEVRLDSIDSLSQHIKQRENLFISRLGAMSMDWFGSWQRITKNENEMIEKVGDEPDPSNLFTAKNTCALASFALFDGLVSHEHPNLDIEVMGISTDINAENKRHPQYVMHPRAHDVVRVTQKDTGRTLLVDATYAQIDHRYAGRIVLIPEEKLNEFYPDRGTRIVKSGTEYMEEEREFVDKALKNMEVPGGIKNPSYKKLVSTV